MNLLTPSYFISTVSLQIYDETRFWECSLFPGGSLLRMPRGGRWGSDPEKAFSSFCPRPNFSSFYPLPNFHLFILVHIFIFLSSPNPYDVPLKWLFHPRTLVPLPVLLWCKQDVLVFWTNQSLQAFIPLSPFLRVPHGIRSLLMLLNYWRTSDLWQAKFVTTKWQGIISTLGGWGGIIPLNLLNITFLKKSYIFLFLF